MITIRIHIDQQPHESPNPTTGAALYALGQVQQGLELFREVHGDKEDPGVLNDAEAVHLKQDEHFHSGQPVVKEFEIFVNTRARTVAGPRVKFDQLVKLAFDPVPTGPDLMFTITYRDGPYANPTGHVLEGQWVKVNDGMKFVVTPTNKS